MAAGNVQVYYGQGRGKSPAAFGQAIKAAAEGKTVIIIQFLKGKMDEELDFMKRLEPEIKIFRFEKSEEHYSRLSPEEQTEEAKNIRNGLNFSKKVLVTGECNLLILDEVLGLVDNGLLTLEDLENVIHAKSEDTEIILTGRVLREEFRDIADEIYNIAAE